MTSTAPPFGQSGKPVSPDSVSGDELGRSWRRRALKTAIVMMFVAIGVALVIRNANSVQVDFLVGTGHPRLIWVILTSFSVGLIVGFGLGGPGRRFVARRRQRSRGTPRVRRN